MIILEMEDLLSKLRNVKKLEQVSIAENMKDLRVPWACLQ